MVVYSVSEPFSSGKEKIFDHKGICGLPGVVSCSKFLQVVSALGPKFH